ncbi:MAG: 3-oxoacyl-acyl-carrier protein reductase [Bacteroidetes bacterium]|nr:MAG: 3-oxoacyl-acyl-carrier protein reductase [Bacteroidota bacterium]
MKFALVTGASRGIGKAIAQKLAGDGFYVLLNYHTNRVAAEETLREILDHGGQGELLPFDVSDNAQVETVLGAWAERNPDNYIEVLVNNAGIRDDGLMVFMSVDQWKNVISTNLDSFFYVTRQVLQPMLIRKQGRIISIVSLSGQKGQPGQTNYSAAKAGIIGASKSLAMEIGKKKVTVNCVSPGFIETDMTKDLDAELLKKLVPLNRFGTPDDVAEVVGFLASPESKYITGEVISVNGGIYS